MLARIKKNDTVVVLSGKDKGKQGLVLAVDVRKQKAVVKDVAIVTRHTKSTKAGQKGSIVKKESPVHLSKMMPICTACKKPCRIKVKLGEASSKMRVCHHCNEAF
jgi:large subunit ribosomal protein L24